MNCELYPLTAQLGIRVEVPSRSLPVWVNSPNHYNIRTTTYAIREI